LQDIPASEEDLAYLLAEASKMATESFFADVDDGRVRFTAADLETPFELFSSSNFDEAFISPVKKAEDLRDPEDYSAMRSGSRWLRIPPSESV
jgi:hypothetical protein